MKLTIFGATGGTGKQLVRQALDAGHAVTAVVRDPARLPISHASLEVVTADVTDAGALRPLVEGRDAVLSSLGAGSRSGAGIATAGTTAILTAMAESGVRRFVAVSAMPVGPVPPGESLFFRGVRRVLLTALKDVYADLARMEAEIARSDTDWTVLWPPQLTDGPLTGAYAREIGANVAKRHKISRADLAHAMLAALDDPATVRRSVGVGS
ncbi:epimerase [Prauserella sp. PE36]|uniref:NAD(P)-dependent oxidoreductase n=1 Tax=Prauserella sp. PE36 TaxID=1504709 RepID=UPI000D94FD76|nr:SDR family oxidoreductase [Prauserella sp. PE36]PXY29328.1 epimerase [Prauserella coralliicola]RBM22182.1 epimerase [Prauserella sp. PE36]